MLHRPLYSLTRMLFNHVYAANELSFSFAIHPIILQLKSKLKLFYLCEGTLGGEPETILGDVQTLIND